MQNNQLTIVAVSDVKIKDTIYSLIISRKSLKAKKAILFSSKDIILSQIESELINFIKIKPINSIKDYSNFIIYKLYKYIETSHTLIVQWDGFICNKMKWNKKFLKYDYIGAPFIPRHYDRSYSRDLRGAYFVIGNGGFSLRSKKLLEAPTKLNLKDNYNFTNYHEDGFFCVLHRDYLESKGFVWAPFYLAKEFAIETPISIKDLMTLPLGFHGKKMLLLVKILKKLKRLIKYLKFF